MSESNHNLEFPNFNEIKVSTRTFISMTNLNIDLSKLFNFLPITNYTVIPKKRGRKPKENVSVNNVVFNKINEEQVILHLPIKTNKLSNTEIIENKLLRYNPSILVPEPFEPELFAHPLDDNQTNELTNTLNENLFLK